MSELAPALSSPRRPQMLIMHSIAVPETEALATLRGEREPVCSAHYAVGEDGRIHALVADTYRAWHAGESSWLGLRDVNSLSLGIELINDEPRRRHGVKPFTPEQLHATRDLMNSLIQRYTIAPRFILAHSDVAPLRREDPGALFPWQTLAREGIGLWPALPDNDDTSVISDPAIWRNFLQHLKIYGYGVNVTNPIAKENNAALWAFQRHFSPHLVTGYLTHDAAAKAAWLAEYVITN